MIKKISRTPTHPGEILLKEIIPATQLSPEMLASKIGISLQEISKILKTHAPVTPKIAAGLGTLFNNSPRFWSNLQEKYDIWNTKQ